MAPLHQILRGSDRCRQCFPEIKDVFVQCDPLSERSAEVQHFCVRDIQSVQRLMKIGNPTCVERGIDRPVGFPLEQRREAIGLPERRLELGHENVDQPGLQIAHEPGRSRCIPKASLSARRFENEVHVVDKERPVQRLGEEGFHTEIKRAFNRAGVIMARDNQNREIRLFQRVANSADHIEAGKTRKCQIKDHQIKGGSFDFAHRGLAIRRADNTESSLDQRCRCQLPIKGIVVNE